MGLLKIYRFIAQILFILSLASFGQTQAAQTIDIYVSPTWENLDDKKPQGSAENPFLKLSDALMSPRNSDEQVELNIHVAPTIDSYILTDFFESFGSQNMEKFSLSLWEDSPFCKINEYKCTRKPTIEMINSSLYFFELEKINITGFHIKGQNLETTPMELQRSKMLFLKDVSFDSVETKNAFFKVEEAENIVLTNIDINSSSCGFLLDYSKIDNHGKAADITVENITINTDSKRSIVQGEFLLSFTTTEKQGKIDMHDILVNAEGLFRGFTKIKGFEEIKITDLKVEKSSLMLLENTNSFLSIDSGSSLEISKIEVKGNKITGNSSFSLMNIQDMRVVSIADLVIELNNLTITSKNTFNVLNISDIIKMRVQDVTLSKNTLDGNFKVLKIGSERMSRTFSSVNLDILNVMINDNFNIQPSNAFSFLSFEGLVLETFNLDTVNFINNKLFNRVFALQGYVPSQAELTGPRQLNMKKINIKDNYDASDINFLYFFPNDEYLCLDNCLQVIEPYTLKIQDLTVENNNFYKGESNFWFYEGNLFQIKQTQIIIDNLKMTNCSFSSYNFINLDQKPSTLMLLSSEVRNTTLTRSQLIMSNYLNKYSYFSTEERYMTSVTPLYRYSLIFDCSFSDLKLVSSDLLGLDNGFFILKKNIFNELSLSDGSNLVSVEFVPLKLQSNELKYSRDLNIEKLAFSLNEMAWDLLNKETEDVVYFAKMIGNEFGSVVLSDSQLFVFSGFGFKQSLIQFEGTTLIGISSESGENNPLINIDDFGAMMINQDKFYKVKSSGAIFSFPRATSSMSLTVQDGFYEGIEVASFLDYKGKNLTNMDFKNNKFLSAQFDVSLITISSLIASGNWSINNNEVNSTFLIFDESKIQGERFGFIHLFAVETLAEKKSQVLLTNNSFSDISMYMKNRRPIPVLTSLLYINTRQALKAKNISVMRVNNLDQGSLIYTLNLPSFTMKNSTFEECSASSSTGLITLSAETIEVSNCSFKQMANINFFGLFYIGAYLDEHSVKFVNNTFYSITQGAMGGLITVRTTTIETSERKQKFNVREDAVLPKLNLEISNCNMSRLIGGPAVHLSTIECSPCKIINNSFKITVLSSEYAIELTEGVSGFCLVKAPRVEMQANAEATLLRISNFRGSVSLEDFHYKGGKSAPFCIVSTDSGNFTLKDSSYQDVKLTGSPVIRVVTDIETDLSLVGRVLPRINLESNDFNSVENPNDKFANIVWNIKDPMMIALMVSLRMSEDIIQFRDMLQYQYNSTSKYMSASVFFSGMPTILNVRNCIFQNLKRTSGLLFVRSTNLVPSPKLRSSEIQIEGSNFSSISHFTGTALNVLPLAYSPTIKILSSNFRKTTAYIGGSLVVYDSKLTVEDCQFMETWALSQGSAIMLGGTTQNEFKQKNLTMEENFSPDNQAIVFEAVDFRLKFILQDEDGENKISQDFDPKSNTSILSVSNLEFLRGSLMVEFFDSKGNLAPDYIGFELVKAKISIGNHERTKLPKTFTPNINKQNEPKRASISLNNVLIGGFAGEEISVGLSFTSGRMMNAEKRFIVKFRACQAGEFNNTNSYMCQECVAPTFSTNASLPCTKCPTNANCPLQSKVCPRESYWNKDPSSELVFKCREDNVGRCSNETNCQTCAHGYTGPLCEACDFDNSFVEVGYLKCGLCQDPGKSLKYSILFGIMYFLYQVFSIYTIFYANKNLDANENNFLTKRRIERSYYIKSLLTYTQIMSILFINNSQIYRIFGLTSQVGNPSSLVVYGTQCSLKALGILHKDILFYQTYIVILSPFMQLIGLAVFLLIVSRFSKDMPLKKLLVAALIFFMISYQPGIINNLAQFLSCTTLKDLGYDYISSHPYWTCNDSAYLNFSSHIVKPSLVAWCFLIPAVLLTILRKRKNQLKEEDTSGMLGMLYADLNLDHYYWGIVLMVLKLALSFLVYGLERDAQVQICVSLILLWGYQSLVRIKKPYRNKNFNKFEILLINLLMFNIVVTTYGLHPSEGGSVASVLSVVISVLFNGGFLLLVIFKIVSLTIINLLATVEKNVFKRRVTRKILLNDDSLNSNVDHNTSSPNLVL